MALKGEVVLEAIALAESDECTNTTKAKRVVLQMDAYRNVFTENDANGFGAKVDEIVVKVDAVSTMIEKST